jgi:heme ABC exporter ATP-binding subunit CcmA
MPPALAFRQAVCLVGGFPVLAGLDLEVDEGETVLVHGPNGAGKTSLLRACAGLVALSAGEANVLGYDLRTDRMALRSEVGLVGHHSALYEDLTVEDNLRFAVRAAHGDAAQIPAALERLGLSGRLRRMRYSRLSAGQRRRATLAVLIARRPRLWLMDEPHAGLDADGRDVLDQCIAEARALGCTVLLASHELDRAAAVCDRAVEIAGGVARQSTLVIDSPRHAAVELVRERPVDVA